MKSALLGPVMGVVAAVLAGFANIGTNNKAALWAFLCAAWAGWAGYLTYEALKTREN